MEEDIKILEDYIELIKKGYCEDCNELCNIYGAPTYPAKKISEATEHLIKGYKELEKDLHEMTISNNHKKENWIHKNCLNDYIPKSKIKEKIEELESKIKATFCKYMTEEDYYNNKFLSSDVAEDYEVLEVRKLISNRNLLQELMEDK